MNNITDRETVQIIVERLYSALPFTEKTDGQEKFSNQHLAIVFLIMAIGSAKDSFRKPC